MDGQLGIIAPGAIADLLVLNENPLDDITVLDRSEVYLEAVMKAGRVITSSLPKLRVQPL
jgi:imidazolonepropionase-like amidohydrolase